MVVLALGPRPDLWLNQPVRSGQILLEMPAVKTACIRGGDGIIWYMNQVSIGRSQRTHPACLPEPFLNMSTLADFLEPVLSDIQFALIPPPHRQPLLAAAARFPSALSRSFDLECRLGANQPATDLLICVTRAERPLLAGQQAFALLDPAALAAPLWQRILRFTGAWANPTGILHHKVLNLWYEFDLEPNIQNPLAAPGFFFGSSEFPTRAGDASWFYQDALPVLEGGPLPEPVEANLRRVSALLPAGAHLYQIGVFFARQTPHLRACLTGIPPEELVDYLKAAGYTASLDGLERIIGELAPLCDLHVDLDIGAEIGAKIGLECSQKRASVTTTGENLGRLLDWLARRGLCLAEQQSTLLAYPGVERLPAELAAQTPPDPANPAMLPALERELSHIKVVYQPGQALEAKAYLQITRGRMDALGFTAAQLAFAARRQAALRALEQAQSVSAAVVNPDGMEG